MMKWWQSVLAAGHVSVHGAARQQQAAPAPSTAEPRRRGFLGPHLFHFPEQLLSAFSHPLVRL